MIRRSYELLLCLELLNNPMIIQFLPSSVLHMGRIEDCTQHTQKELRGFLVPSFGVSLVEPSKREIHRAAAGRTAGLQ